MVDLRVIDFNNVWFAILMQRSTSYEHLIQNARTLGQGAKTVYWVADGVNSRKPRQDLYPEYKANRNKVKKSPEVFELMRKFKQTGLQQIGGIYLFEKKELEADDLIAKLVNSHLVSNPSAKIEVLTTDKDMLQLCVNPTVTLPLAKFPPHCLKAGEIKLMKTLVGDSSDNIKGLRLFGNKSWEALSQDHRAIIELGLVEKDIIPILNSNLDPKLILRIQENWEILLVFWTIIGFLEVSDADVIANMKYYPPVAPKPVVMTMNETGVLT